MADVCSEVSPARTNVNPMGQFQLHRSQNPTSEAERNAVVAAPVFAKVSPRTRVPVLAGGLLRDKADVMAAMRAGASAVSTSAPELWDI